MYIMNNSGSDSSSFSRRKFLKSASAALALTVLPGTVLFRKKRNKMILSFYLDDTSPDIVSAEAYKEFLYYCQANGIKGEASIILGYSGKSLVRNPDNNERLFIEQAKQSYNKGIDSHMEIMTHNGLFDFKSDSKNDKAIHEGLWLHKSDIHAKEYYAYFSNIIAEGEKEGIKFTGLTWPGCGCEVCTPAYEELKKSGPLHFNNGVFEALLTLAKEGKFRNRVIPIFYDADETEFGIFRRAAAGKFGVYDLMPNANDHFGIWENSLNRVNADYYITEDGKSGILIKHLENNDPYCMWYMHWQGVNPGKGVGWETFKTVTTRIKQHLSDQVIWMRPSDIVTAYHDAGNWDFTNSL